MPEAMRRFKAELFQGLAHPTRIAILEALRDGELATGDILERVGVEQANLSQHLAVLRSRQLVAHRKAGNQVYYAIRDGRLLELLDLVTRYHHSQLHESLAVLDELNEATRKQ
jgi:DNA-binding transcriptional ArsR family regulator